jgi:lysophospholipase L1-like esterase
VGAAVLIAAASGCSKLGLGSTSPTAPSGPPAPGSTIVYTAIGASDAIGHGSSAECVPFTSCPDGRGYVQDAVRSLTASGFKVTLYNLGVPTAVIGQDFQNLSAQYRPNDVVAGNFIDGEEPFVQQNTTVVTVFAGGNDVNTITAALGGGAGGADPAGYIDQEVRAFGADFTTLLNGIRGRSPSARIVALNLPNLGALPYLAGDSQAKREAAQRAAVGITTTVVNPVVAQGVTVVDLMCDPRSYLASNYSSDGFHPNDAGYAFIAGEVVKAITAAYPAPMSTCSQMTLVP